MNDEQSIYQYSVCVLFKSSHLSENQHHKTSKEIFPRISSIWDEIKFKSKNAFKVGLKFSW